MFIIGAILRWAVLVGYAACAWLYLSRLLSARPAENRGPEILLSLVVLLHGATLAEAALEHGRLIFLTTALQATTVYAIVLAVWTLLIGRKSRNQAFGAFAVPIALLLYLVALLHRPHPVGIKPYLDSSWFEVHAMSAFLGYAAFCLAFVAAVMYLLLMKEIRRRNLGRLFNRLPSLESLDQLGFHSILVGFLFFTAALVSGSIWGRQAFGHYFSGEIKEWLSFVTWLAAAVHLAMRYRAGWRGRTMALLSIAVFLISVLTWLGGGAASGRHSL